MMFSSVEDLLEMKPHSQTNRSLTIVWRKWPYDKPAFGRKIAISGYFGSCPSVPDVIFSHAYWARNAFSKIFRHSSRLLGILHSQTKS
jgi:hypothetical protein